MSIIDEAYMEHLSRFPEMIVSIGDWEIFKSCSVCKQEIQKDHPCLFKGRMFNEYKCDAKSFYQRRFCPHCKEPAPYKDDDNEDSKAPITYITASQGGVYNGWAVIGCRALPTTLHRKRKIVTKEKEVIKRLFRKPIIIPEEYRWEIEELKKS